MNPPPTAADATAPFPIPLGSMAFTRPDFAPASSFWLGHIPFAFWVVEHAQPSTFVELGVHTGGSFCNFCEAVKTLHLDCRCFGVDNFEGDAHYGPYGSEVLETLKAYHDPRYQDFSTLIKADFTKALSYFEDGSIDLLHIDGTHFYEDVLRDYQQWKPKLGPRAVVLFHDTNVHERDFGVHKVWRELTAVHRGFEFLHCNGLGVLIPGDAPTPALEALVSADESDTVVIRRFFHSLGDRISTLAELSVAAQRIHKLESDEKTLRTWLQEKEEFARNELAAYQELERVNAGLREEAGNLREETGKLREEASRLYTRLEEERQDKAALQAECDQAIHKVQSLDSSLQQTHVNHATQLAAVQKETRRLTGEVALLDAARNAAKSCWQYAPTTRLPDMKWIARLIPGLAPLARSGLFDATFYRSQFPAGKKLGNPLRHYQTIGWLMGCKPNPVFDPTWYASTYAVAKGVDPLSDYVTSGRPQGRKPHPLFDEEFYLSEDAALARYRYLPLRHYLASGRKEGRKPCALFDPGYYTGRYPDVPLENALEHFMEKGWRMGHNPHPLFDTEWYISRHGAELGGKNPLVHYLENGHLTAYSPHPLFDPPFYLKSSGRNPQGNLLVDYLLYCGAAPVSTHPLFDAHRYLALYPHVGAAGLPLVYHYATQIGGADYSPHILFDGDFYQIGLGAPVTENLLAHYIKSGGRSGPDPHPLFDTRFYLSRCKNPPDSATIPLVHFLQTGAAHADNPHPLFDTAFYLQSYPDVADTGGNPLVHFLETGAAEGRMPNAFFETRRYQNAAMQKAVPGTNPLIHFLHSPLDKLVDPSHSFHAGWYLERYPDVAEQKINPLVHFLATGMQEGRQTCAAGVKNARLESKYPGITHPIGIDVRNQLKNFHRTPRTRIVTGGQTRVNMLFPDLDAEIVFGGYISAFEFLASLAPHYEIRLVCTGQIMDDTGIEALRNKFQSNPRVFRMLQAASLADISNPDTVLDIHPHDVFCAYSAWDALLCNKLAQALGQKESIYFCQEDEAIFHCNDSLHAMIREAQQLPQFFLFNTSILRDFFRANRLGPFAESEQAGFAHSLAFQHALVDAKPPTAADMAARTKTKVLVYARPEGHAKRNLFEITLLGLEKFIEENPEQASTLEFTGVGSMRFEGDIPLSRGQSIRIQPKISLTDYAASLSQYDIGLSLMYAPHPSILPFEMASAGQVVITNRFGIREDGVLESISGNLVPVDPTPAGVADGLRKALAKVHDHEARIRGAQFNWSRSWEQTFGPEFQNGLSAVITHTIESAGPTPSSHQP